MSDEKFKSEQISVLNEIIKNEDTPNININNFESNISIPNQKNDRKVNFKKSKQVNNQNSKTFVSDDELNNRKHSSPKNSKIVSIDKIDKKI